MDVNAYNKIGMTPLMYACAEDKVSILYVVDTLSILLISSGHRESINFNGLS